MEAVQMLLMDHQREGAEWLAKTPRALLAWDMGVGKTFTLIEAWRATVAPRRMLVVCLASAKENWRREILRMMPQARVAIHDKRKDFDYADGDFTDIVITNYERLDDRRLRRPWGALVLDEAHALKNPGAKRTRHVYGRDGIAAGADNVWLATGTPTPNHPGEMYTHCAALWPVSLRHKGHVMNRWEFETHFCRHTETPFGRKIVGGKNLEELRQRLDRVVHRLRREDVLDLPPLTIGPWALNAKAPVDGGLYADLCKRFGAPDDFSPSSLSDILAQIDNATAAGLRHDVALVKACAAVTLLKEEERDGAAAKTLVFAHHREAIEILRAGLPGAVTLHGGVPVGRRQALVDQFQNDPNTRFFIGQITAAGTSINLQAASQIVFTEAAWTPGENAQAIGRAYRNGQTRPVNVRMLYLPGSIDEVVNKVLARKLDMQTWR